MVLSDGMVHYLKIKKKIEQIYQNYLVALRNFSFKQYLFRTTKKIFLQVLRDFF